MTTVFNKAEGGTSGTTVTAGNSGGSSGNTFDFVQNTPPASVTFDNAHAAHGSLSYKISTGSPTSTVYLVWNTALTSSAVTQAWFRAYIYITANPTTNLVCIAARNGSTIRASVGVNTSGHVILVNATGSAVKTSTTTVPLNQWFRLEGFVIGDASVGQIECKLFTTSADAVTPDETMTTTAVQNTGGTINRYDFGNQVTVASYTHWMDDIAASTTSYLGPALVTGTGAVTLKKMTAGGSGSVKVTGTGAVTLKKMTVSGSGFTTGNFRISWDGADRRYSQGISNGVLYPKNSPGVPWNGLISVTEKGDDNATSLFIDGQPYRNSITPSTFAGTLSAFMYPDDLEPYIGVSSGIGITGQPRKSFGLAYRDNNEIHLVYNVLLGPSSDKYSSIGSSTDSIAFQWDFTTTPVNIPGGKPSAHLVIMVDHASPDAVSALEDLIYGDDANEPALPDPTTIYNLFDSYAFLRIVDNEDGTWTADDTLGSILTMLDGETFQIDWASAVLIDTNDYTIRSL